MVTQNGTVREKVDARIVYSILDKFHVDLYSIQSSKKNETN